jgi:toxin FitB
MIILDTNVLSEISKMDPAPSVDRWLLLQEPSEIFVTAITQAEMLAGIERLPAGKRKSGMLAVTEKMFSEVFGERILAFDQEAAPWYAKITAARRKLGRPTSEMDAMIAAIARSRNAALATRDRGGFEHSGVRLIDPWAG